MTLLSAPQVRDSTTACLQTENCAPPTDLPSSHEGAVGSRICKKGEGGYKDARSES